MISGLKSLAIREQVVFSHGMLFPNNNNNHHHHHHHHNHHQFITPENGQHRDSKRIKRIKRIVLTRSSAIAEGSRDALCPFKLCQLVQNCTKSRTLKAAIDA